MKLIKQLPILLSLTIAPTFFASLVSAGPGLYFYYNYYSLNKSECMSAGYRALGRRSLSIPSNVSGSADSFAIGESDTVTVIVDCSEVGRNGRVTVMASSNNPDVANSYARSILNEMKPQ